jgi:hypothetical protein
MPDTFPKVSVLGEIESRVGIPSIESLLAERDDLVKQVSVLRAKHGPFGLFDAERKVQLATIAASIRARALSDAKKVTEASIDEAAHADPRYVDWLTQMTQEKAEWAILENRIAGIGELIRRGDAVTRYLTAEVGLSR